MLSICQSFPCQNFEITNSHKFYPTRILCYTVLISVQIWKYQAKQPMKFAKHVFVLIPSKKVDKHNKHGSPKFTLLKMFAHSNLIKQQKAN